MSKRLNIASWILMGVLILPLLQQVSGLVHEKKLKGAVKVVDYPNFSVKGWFEEEYQKELEPALNDRFGFRNIFIRVNNQVAFSLYRKALANGVEIGKKNFLYEKNYILAQQGDDYLGDSLIELNALKLKGIQNYCEENGKHFLLVFAAGKGSFYPEYIPDIFISEKKKTNIQGYSQAFDTLGINYINFNSWFVEMKDTSRYCLYPKTGIHWSYYGMVLVIDSLNNYLSAVTGKPMPVFEWGDIRESRRYRGSDRDIEEGMNLIFRINHDKMAYPKFSYNDDNVSKPRGVVIADSFYWGIHNMGFSNRIFEKGEFWYYNKQIYAAHLDKVANLDDIDRLDRLADIDVIIMMATEATIKVFPFGFEDLLASRGL